MSKDAKVEVKPEAKVEAKPAAPVPVKMRRWGGKEYPETDFVRVTFLETVGINGERFAKGKSGDVPKAVFEFTLKPHNQAKLWERPRPVMAMARPATDKGHFRRMS